MKKLLVLVLILTAPTLYLKAQNPPGKGYKSIIIDSAYEHNKWGIEPSDLVFKFAAYITSFDSDDDNNGDGRADIWGIPEWVAYEVKKETHPDTLHYNRPTWMTDDTLHDQGIAPDDDTYAVTGTSLLPEVKTSYRYVRGHMCPKDAADRISMEAGYNTHTILNGVPQLQWNNNGIWKTLEKKILDWADKYGSVWIVCGPVFFNKTPAVWLGQDDEVKAAVPDALYKIVIREADTDTGLETLAFIIPNVIPQEIKDYSVFLTSIDRIESLTGLTFLANLGEEFQAREKTKHLNLPDSTKAEMVNLW